MRIVEGFRNLVKNEDPIVWKSLVIASALTLAFYGFVLIYAR